MIDGERDWVQVSHEMAAMMGAGTMPQHPWPADPVAFSFQLGGVGTPATVHFHRSATAPALEASRLVLIVAASAIERMFGHLPLDKDGAFHITKELREIALAISDCTLPEGARLPYRLAKCIELLCDTLQAIEAHVLVPALGGCPLPQEDSRRILSAHAMIEERWSEKLTLDSLSRACGLNRAKLTRGFREMFDCSVADALSERRLEGARKMLLSTDMSISSIGYRCGYLNNASFTRAFTRRFGAAPTLYRAGRIAA